MLVLAINTGLACAEYEAAVVDPGMVSYELFFGDEVYCRIVISEIVGHLLDGLLDKSKICAFFSYYEALS